MLNSLGWPELVVVAFLVVLMFGGKKVPELARGLAESLREFKKAAKEE